jgi:hypothetical protein
MCVTVHSYGRITPTQASCSPGYGCSGYAYAQRCYLAFHHPIAISSYGSERYTPGAISADQPIAAAFRSMAPMTTPKGPIRTLHGNSQGTGDTIAHCYSEIVYLGGEGSLTFVRDPGFEVPHVATCRRNVGRLPNVCTRTTSSCARQNHRNHSF